MALADDHHLMRSALAAAINGLGGFRVTAEAGDGRELQQLLAGAASPDLAIIDLRMPVMDGYATIAWLREQHPACRALALTYDASDDALARAMVAGARGFLLKSAKPTELREALETVAREGYYLGEPGRARAQAAREALGEARERARIRSEVTPRELEFLRLLCDPGELTYEQIGERMGVKPRTVEFFRTSLCDKFGLRSKTGLVLFALKWGLVRP